MVNKINKNDYLMILEDLNAQIGNTRISNIVGKNEEATINSDGKKIIDFRSFNSLRVMNTFFKHKDIHKYTWSATGLQSIINYRITNEKTAKLIHDVRVYRGTELITENKLLCTKITSPPKG
jgi:hypothetical protein